jgi:hypothetical protein
VTWCSSRSDGAVVVVFMSLEPFFVPGGFYAMTGRIEELQVGVVDVSIKLNQPS